MYILLTAYLRLKILHDFCGKSKDELEVKKGEIVIMIEAQEEWTKVKNEFGSVGLIPRNYYINESEDTVLTLQQVLFSNYNYKQIREYLQHSQPGIYCI